MSKPIKTNGTRAIVGIVAIVAIDNGGWRLFH